VDALLDLWRQICVPAGLPDVRIFDEALRTKCRTRLAEEPSLETWREVFARIAASAFCRGEVDGRNGAKSWHADFRWITANESNRAKVLEGRYDDAAKSQRGRVTAEDVERAYGQRHTGEAVR
jgi:hypothetical protein